MADYNLINLKNNISFGILGQNDLQNSLVSDRLAVCAGLTHSHSELAPSSERHSINMTPRGPGDPRLARWGSLFTQSTTN